MEKESSFAETLSEGIINLAKTSKPGKNKSWIKAQQVEVPIVSSKPFLGYNSLYNHCDKKFIFVSNGDLVLKGIRKKNS